MNDEPQMQDMYGSATPGRSAFRREALGFLLVGGANFILTFILFYSMYRLLEWDYSIALLLSWAVGMAFTYLANFHWVFVPDGSAASATRFGRYLASQSVSIGLNLMALNAIARSTGWDAFYIQCALIPVIVVFNFSTAKFWSLRKRA